jgi:hypothetical protein
VERDEPYFTTIQYLFIVNFSHLLNRLYIQGIVSGLWREASQVYVGATSVELLSHPKITVFGSVPTTVVDDGGIPAKPVRTS